MIDPSYMRDPVPGDLYELTTLVFFHNGPHRGRHPLSRGRGELVFVYAVEPRHGERSYCVRCLLSDGTVADAFFASGVIHFLTCVRRVSPPFVSSVAVPPSSSHLQRTGD